MCHFLSILLTILFFNSGCKSNTKDQNPISNGADEYVITVSTLEESNKIGSDFWGFNAQMMRGPRWKAPGFIEQVKLLHPQIIRYPGGTVASYWDWKTG